MSGFESTKKPAGWMRRLGPGVIALCLLADVSLRFAPPRWFAFRAWEANTLFVTGPGPFTVNSRYRNARSYGDLANQANLPELRQYREEIFTTDSLGYRNTREAPRPFEGILVLGDSFAAGSGVPDEATLSERLRARTGCPVYDGAGNNDPLRVVDELRMKSGVVLWEVNARYDVPRAGETPHEALPGRVLDRVLGAGRTNSLRIEWQGRTRYAPAGILAARAVKRFENDAILPNPYRSQVMEGRLQNGTRLLMLPAELQGYNLKRPVDVTWLSGESRQLAARGIRLAMVFVPDKLVVYRHFLTEPKGLPAETAPTYTAMAARRLNDAGVEAYSLEGDFREKAAEWMEARRYLYWLDDTHWTPAGIDEGARWMVEAAKLGRCGGK